MLIAFLALACVAAAAASGQTRPARVLVEMPDGTQLAYVPASQPTTVPATQPATRPARSGWVGVHLESNSDYNRARYFIDVMKESRKWGSTTRPYDGSAPTDAQGWPTADAGTFVLTDWPKEAISGDYPITWKGAGKLSVTGSAKVLSQSYDPATDAGSGVVRVTGGSIGVVFTGTAGGVRDVAMLRPRYANDSLTFTAEFRLALEPFAAFRCMDLLRTNNSTASRWAERAQLTDATYSLRGWPYEACVELANQTGKDLYINVPALADDDYVRQLAALVRATLRPGLACYVEYSNEVWNGQFAQCQQNERLAAAEVAAGERTLNLGGADANRIYWARRRIAKRTIEIGRLLDGPPFRVVLATAVNVPGVAQMQLDYVARYHGPPADFFHAVAGAPYFSPGRNPDNSQWTRNTPLTVDQIIERLAPRARQHANLEGQQALTALAKRHGLRQLWYEAGVDLQQFTTDVPAKSASQLDPRMGAIFEDYLNAGFDDAGVDGMFLLSLTSTYGRHGYWGLTTDAADRAQPKYRAAVKVAGERRQR